MQHLLKRATKWYMEARHQAQRRKSRWNLILIPLCGGAWLVGWYALFRLVWIFHTTLYPEHALRDFWHEGISFKSFVSSFLMVFAIAPAALSIGSMVGNLLAYAIPPARRTFDAESKGYPGTSFPEGMRFLWKVTAWALPLGLLVALIGGYTLKSLR